MLWFLLLSSFFPYLLWPVELAALHAAAKNIINLTARTDGMYGGGAPCPVLPVYGIYWMWRSA